LRNKLIIALAMLLGSLGIAGAVTLAHTGPTATEVIHACVGASGKLVIVEAAEECNGSQVALDWNGQGIQGIQGTVGPTGATGAAGLKGVPGVNTILVGGGGQTPPLPDAFFLPMFGSNGTDVDEQRSEGGNQVIVPAAGDLSQFKVHINPQLARPVASLTFTVRKNGIDQAISCQIVGDADVSCEDNPNVVSFLTGDLFSLKATPLFTLQVITVRWTAQYVTAP